MSAKTPSAPVPAFDRAVVVMGVSGCGKSTIGAALAAQLGVTFIEGDALHGAANIAKMSAGIPLDDDDRWPWLARVGAALRSSQGCVVSCSALKRSYRQAIAQAAGKPVCLVFLEGTRDDLHARLGARKGHFMPGLLLDSQFATLEPPGHDETVITLNITLPVDVLIDRAAEFLTEQE